MKKIGVFTSGGDSPGMNACIRAVVRTGIHFGLEVVGIKRGFQGLIDKEFIPLYNHSVSRIIKQGGTMLHSARSEAFRTKEGRQKAYKNLVDEDIEAIVVIGGDGSFTGANIFINEFNFPIIGCPGTIDNDLFGTDFTIGYDTAINTAMEAIDKIKDTANAHDRLFFIEVMGRDAGFIALSAGVAVGAEAVLIPESKTDIDSLVNMLKRNYQKKKTSNIIVVAEGDDAGGAFQIAAAVKERMDNIDMRVTILGHIQRGGKPTAMERVRASRMGMEAVKALLKGRRGEMVGIINNKIVFTPFEKAIKYNHEINPVMLEMVNILS